MSTPAWGCRTLRLLIRHVFRRRRRLRLRAARRRDWPSRRHRIPDDDKGHLARLQQPRSDARHVFLGDRVHERVALVDVVDRVAEDLKFQELILCLGQNVYSTPPKRPLCFLALVPMVGGSWPWI